MRRLARLSVPKVRPRLRERNAADNLHAFGAEDADDFAGVLIEFGAARNERAIFDDGAPGGRGFARDGEFGLESPWRPGKSSA